MNRADAALRDHYAGIAMAEFIRGHRWDENHRDGVAVVCFSWADSMLKARKLSDGAKRARRSARRNPKRGAYR